MKNEPKSNNLPPSLEPFYRMKKPNDPILLYEGILELILEDRLLQGDGNISLTWLPMPHIFFNFICGDACSNSNNKDPELKIVDLEVVAKVLITSRQIGSAEEIISGQISGSVFQGVDKNLSSIKFHLSNFHKFIGFSKSSFIEGFSNCLTERAIFEADGWIITLDQIPKSDEQEKLLKSQIGYNLTHVGKVERSDKRDFSKDEVEEILQVFGSFLSFTRGFRVSPMLLIGYDVDETVIFKEWSSVNASPYNSVSSWFPEADRGNFSQIFPDFLRWRRDWGDSAELTLYWYLESNKGSVESGIILQQAALELIAWVFLCEKQGYISKDGFDKLPASDKQRILLSHFNIPLKIPSHLIDLIQFAEHNRWVDGPHAFTEIRNGLTHPRKRQKIMEAPTQARIDAWILGLWYIELCLLRILHYNGPYINRCIRVRSYGQTEMVPWV